MDVFGAVEAGVWIRLVRVLVFVALVCFVLRARPWRWLVVWLRGVHRG